MRKWVNDAQLAFSLLIIPQVAIHSLTHSAIHPLLKDYLKLHFIVLLWGFTAILGKLLTVPPVELVFWRTLLAATGLAVLLGVRRMPWRVSAGQAVRLLAVGALVATHWITFFLAARLYLVSQAELDQLLGLGVAVLSAGLSALFSVLNAKLIKTHSPLRLTFYEMLGACLSIVLFFPIYSHYFTRGRGLQLAWHGYDWLWLALLAGVCTVYAFSTSVELMKRLSPFAVNLTINLEPVYGIVLAVLVFGNQERMAAGFYWGTLLIVFSVLIHPLVARLMKAKEPELEATLPV